MSLRIWSYLSCEDSRQREKSNMKARLTHDECYEAENILADVVEVAHREAVTECE